jgi:hypothetical protein
VENPENPKDDGQDSLHSECTIDSGLKSAYFLAARILAHDALAIQMDTCKPRSSGEEYLVQSQRT